MWVLNKNDYSKEYGIGYAFMFNSIDGYYLEVMYRCRPYYNSVRFYYSYNPHESEKVELENVIVKHLRENNILRSDDYVGSEGSSRLF